MAGNVARKSQLSSSSPAASGVKTNVFSPSPLSANFPFFSEPHWWWPTSEAALVADARAAVEWLVYEKGVVPKRVVLWGHGLGSGVAASLAREWSDPVFLPHPVSSPATNNGGSSRSMNSGGALPGGDAEAAGGDLGALVLESGFSSLADYWSNQHSGILGWCQWLPACHSRLLPEALHQSPFKLATADHVAALVEQGAHTSVSKQINENKTW